MTEYKTSIFFMACTVVLATQHVALGNPNQINSGNLALHVPFDLEPSETVDGRSLGMGNASVAVVDDSTAAAINPAGLATIQDIEFTASLRHSSYKTDYLDTYAAMYNIGLGPDLEETRAFDNDITDFSFIGFTLPIAPGKLAASIYYKSSSFEGVDTQDVGPETTFLNIQQQHISRKEIDTYQKAAYGLAGAFNFENVFSIGASVNLEQLDTGLQEQWTIKTFNNYQLDTKDEYNSRVEGDDTEVTFAIGALYKPVEGMSIGVSYRQGANFTIPYTSSSITCNALGSCNKVQEDDNVTFDIPDVLGVGIAWKPLNDWLFSVQMDMVEYSVLQDATTEGITMDETIDDGIIFRFGVEKSFYVSDASQYQLRAGMFSIPDHDGFQAIDSDTVYYTLGGGMTLNEQIKVNVGTSFSEDLMDAVLSFSYIF
jgi:long-subunit fatty acid transport protein